MDEQKFINELASHQIHLTEQQLQQFQIYYEELIDWNKKINLTAIVEKKRSLFKTFL